MIIYECVAFLLVKNQCFLVEKRKSNKKVDPGLIAIPGGHCDENESIEQALERELLEELGVTIKNKTYLCSQIHETEERQRIHYYLIDEWKGSIVNNEAEYLKWLPFHESNLLEIPADIIAIKEYLKLLA